VVENCFQLTGIGRDAYLKTDSCVVNILLNMLRILDLNIRFERCSENSSRVAVNATNGFSLLSVAFILSTVIP